VIAPPMTIRREIDPGTNADDSSKIAYKYFGVGKKAMICQHPWNSSNDDTEAKLFMLTESNVFVTEKGTVPCASG